MKRTLAFAASLLLLGACSSDGYTIRGKIAGLDNPLRLPLCATRARWRSSTRPRSPRGDFVFKGKAEQPEVVYLSTDKQQPFVHFFLENGRISVDGALSAPADIAVLGTPSNDIQRAFDEKIAALEEEFAKTGNDVRATACARSTQADVRRRGDEPRQYLRRDHVPEQRLRLPFARGR